MSIDALTDPLGALLLARASGPARLGPYWDATVAIDVVDGTGWTLHVRRRRISLSVGVLGEPETTVVTDADTLHDVASGERSSIDAFLAGDLRVRGNLELALRLSSLFLEAETPITFPRPFDIRAGGVRTFMLEAGEGPPLVLLHGLGATNASMLPTMAAFSRDHRVLAPDLPGFGGSDKPLKKLHAAYFASWLVDYLDAVGVERADLVGNSMGGRIAIETGLRYPDRVRRIGLFAPSPAFLNERKHLWLVRLLRPELALLPMPSLSRGRVTRTVKAMFHDRSGLPEGWVNAAVDEFLRVYATPRGRRAFFSAARQIYLEDPYEGRGRFWTRLKELDRPTLFIWGAADRLVPVGFAPHVERTLPAAQSIVLENCGHVPQFERPDDTHLALREFLRAHTVDLDSERASQRRAVNEGD